MTDQQSTETQPETPKRHYKPRTPDVEKVLKALGEGVYDENIFEIRDAVEARMKLKQDAALELVKQVFGEDATIMMQRTRVEESSGAPMPGGQPQEPTRENPFVQRAAAKAPPVPATDHSQSALDELEERHPQLAEVAQMLPGPYRQSPTDQNAYRLDDTATNPEGMVTVTDIFGGHAVSVQATEFENWPEVPASSWKSLDERLNEKEQEMRGEATPGETVVVAETPIERRGAIIGGLHSSDIGD